MVKLLRNIGIIQMKVVEYTRYQNATAHAQCVPASAVEIILFIIVELEDVGEIPDMSLATTCSSTVEIAPFSIDTVDNNIFRSAVWHETFLRSS